MTAMTAEKNILVVAEATRGKVPSATYELLTLACRLKATTGGALGVVLLDEGDVDGVRRLWSLKLVPEADLGKSSVLFRLRQNHDRLGSVKLLGWFLTFLGRR